MLYRDLCLGLYCSLSMSAVFLAFFSVTDTSAFLPYVYSSLTWCTTWHMEVNLTKCRHTRACNNNISAHCVICSMKLETVPVYKYVTNILQPFQVRTHWVHSNGAPYVLHYVIQLWCFTNWPQARAFPNSWVENMVVVPVVHDDHWNVSFVDRSGCGGGQAKTTICSCLVEQSLQDPGPKKQNTPWQKEPMFTQFEHPIHRLWAVKVDSHQHRTNEHKNPKTFGSMMLTSHALGLFVFCAATCKPSMPVSLRGYSCASTLGKG